jgi:hypothetical protein
MRMFGPFYPGRLQAAVNHAERVAELLSALEAGAPQADEWAWAWVTGRASEIERLVEHLATAWRRGEVAEPEAAAALDRYLGILHEGMRQHLGLPSPACCVGSAAATAPSTGSGAATPEQHMARPHGGGTTVPGPLSIEDLLDGLFRP